VNRSWGVRHIDRDTLKGWPTPSMDSGRLFSPPPPPLGVPRRPRHRAIHGPHSLHHFAHIAACRSLAFGQSAQRAAYFRPWSCRPQSCAAHSGMAIRTSSVRSLCGGRGRNISRAWCEGSVINVTPPAIEFAEWQALLHWSSSRKNPIGFINDAWTI